MYATCAYVLPRRYDTAPDNGAGELKFMRGSVHGGGQRTSDNMC